jgi:DNA invertase Pin-like site-specific DNA recombinase
VTTTGKRVAAYARVSSDEQAANGTSMSTQAERCLGYVAEIGGQLVRDLGGQEPADVFADGGESGAKAKRPALDRLMLAVEQGQVDVIVVTKWDRLGRSLNNLTSLWATLDAAGVEAVSLGDPESSGRRGRFVRNILASVAEEEREAIRERTTLGRVARLRQAGGGWAGGEPPLGFRVQGQGRDARLVLDDHEVAMIRYAVALLLDRGMTTGEAAAALNSEGYLPRKAPRWTALLLRNHLMRGAWGGVWQYAKPGSRRQGHDLVPDAVSVAIPEVLDATRYAALLSHLQNTSIARVKETVHPLSGLIVGECGHVYTGVARRDRGRRRYRCRYSKDTTARAERCTGRTLLAQELDDLVWRQVVRRLSDPELLLAEAEERLGLLAGSASAEEDALGRAQGEVERCERALGDLFARAVKAGLDDNALEQAKRTLESDLLAARHHQAAIATMREATREASGRLSAMHEAARMAEKLADADDALRRQVLRLFQVRVEVHEADEEGAPRRVHVAGFMDHSLLLGSTSPRDSGDLSAENRTSRCGRNSVAGPNSSVSPATRASSGARTWLL